MPMATKWANGLRSFDVRGAGTWRFVSAGEWEAGARWL
jgi:hypothetical protein